MLSPAARSIDITLDFSLDDANERYFSGDAEGFARRATVRAAADFLSAIITDDDWSALPVFDQRLVFSNINSSTLVDLDGNTVQGRPDFDGRGYSYTFDTTNRDSIAPNEYVVYVGAHRFDTGTFALAHAGWFASDPRNAAGAAREAFNGAGGKITFNTKYSWFAGANPGVDPTDDYGIQDADKQPEDDSSTDNYYWNAYYQAWEGFDLTSVPEGADLHASVFDLYATAVHELLHALGASGDVVELYAGLDEQGRIIGEHVVAEYGEPVPSLYGSHFAKRTQSTLWGSGENIVSETVLDPDSRATVRKYLTKLDAALLRDLGYDVLVSFETATLAGDYNNSGQVEQGDLNLVLNNWGQAAPFTANGEPFATPQVDQEELNRVLNHWGDTGATPDLSGFANVPEPGWAVTAGWAAALGLRRRPA